MSDATPLFAARGVVLLGLAPACSGLGAWVAGRLGGRALLGLAGLYVLGLALGALLYVALYGVPEELGDAGTWRVVAADLLGE
jgi:hypothetical protein